MVSPAVGACTQVHCLNDVCPHRGAPLSQGWVQEVQGHDCVVCPYHGWAFDKEGVLRDVPAADKAEAWPRKKLVDSYAVEEKVSNLKQAGWCSNDKYAILTNVWINKEAHVIVCVHIPVNVLQSQDIHGPLSLSG